MTAAQQPDLGPVPEDNQPGHHPAVEQDKPTRPPALPRRHHRFRLRRDPRLSLASLPFGVTAENSYVEVDEEALHIRFGPWAIDTTIDNVERAERTGPYRWWKVAGPPRLSLRDSGITFATTASEGVCLRFREPVRAFPVGPLRHRGVTVTVEDPDDLIRVVTGDDSRQRTTLPDGT
jgi:hypothetical protein